MSDHMDTSPEGHSLDTELVVTKIQGEEYLMPKRYSTFY
jgi:hypothetical protein